MSVLGACLRRLGWGGRLVLWVAVASGFGVPVGAVPVAPPNIVFVLSDDHSAPYLGCYGYPVRTPHFDRFAAEGVVCTRAFVSAPQCVPARVALMTGRSPQAARVGRFGSPVPRDVPILPEILRAQASYYTGVCRRSHHLDGWTAPTGKLSLDILTRHGMQSMKERMDYVDNSPPGNTEARMNEFLDRVPAGRPFFLWINLNDPHHPWNAPKVHDPATLPLPPDWPDLPELRGDLARYCDEIARLDDEFQSILNLLAARRLTDSTLVVFCGDNGMAFPKGKGTLYERGLQVPMIWRWPGHFQPGTTYAGLLSGEDFTPTLLAVAGLTPLPAMSGRNQLPALGGTSGPVRTHVFGMREPHGHSIFTPETMASGYDLGRSVRDDRFKLIVNYTPWMRFEPVDSARDPGWLAVLARQASGQLDARFSRAFFQTPRPIIELYDLQQDPYEQNNLAADPAHAATLRRLQESLQEKMITDYDFLPLPLAD